MGISQPLYTIEIFERGEWREYVPGEQRYTMTDEARLVALAQIIMPPKATWRVVEMVSPELVSIPMDDLMKAVNERNALRAEGVRLREVNAELLTALHFVDFTMDVHGHIDAETELHNRIRRALEKAAKAEATP